MKKIILGSLVIMATLFAATAFKTQNASKVSFLAGSIVYTTDYKADSGSGKEEIAKMMDGSESTIKFNGKKFKMEMSMGIMKTSIITKDGKEIYMLMNMMGKKIALKGNSEEMKKLSKKQSGDAAKEITYTLGSETKKILGYPCKKYTAVVEEGGKKYTNVIWSTEEITASGELMNPGSSGVKGFALEAYTYVGGLKTHMLATSFDKSVPDDKEFELPSGYEVKTVEELLGLMGE